MPLDQTPKGSTNNVYNLATYPKKLHVILLTFMNDYCLDLIIHKETQLKRML